MKLLKKVLQHFRENAFCFYLEYRFQMSQILLFLSLPIALLSQESLKNETSLFQNVSGILKDVKIDERTKVDSSISFILSGYRKDPQAAETAALNLLKYSNKRQAIYGQGRALNVLGRIYLFTENIDSSDASFLAAKTIFESSNELWGENESLTGLMKNAVSQGDYKSFDNYAKLVFHNLESIDLRDSHWKMSLFNTHKDIAMSYRSRGQIDSVIVHYGIVENIASELDDTKYMAYLLLDMGAFYEENGQYFKAFEYWLQSIEIANSLNDLTLQSIASLNIAYMHMHLLDYKTAKSGFQQVYDFSKKTGDLFLQRQVLLNLAESSFYVKDYQNALKYYELAESLYDSTDIVSSKFVIHVGKGASFMNLKKYKDADQMFRLALKEVKKPENLITASRLYLNWGALMFRQGKNDKALKYLKQARKIEMDNNSYLLRARASFYLSQIYRETGAYLKAFDMLELHTVEMDSLSQRRAKSQIISLNIKTSYQNKQREDSLVYANEIKIQSAQSDLKDESLKRKSIELEVNRNQQLFLFGGLALMVVFLFFLNNRFRLSKKQNRIIERQKDKNLFLSQKILEQNQQLILGETAKNVAHELNSPLGVIKAGTEGIAHLISQLVDDLLPSYSKGDLEMANYLSNLQTSNVALGFRKRQERTKELEETLVSEFGLVPLASRQLALELSKLHLFHPDEKAIKFLVASSNPQAIYDLTRCVGQLKSISNITLTAANKSADVVSEIRDALNFKLEEEFQDIQLRESIYSVITIIESKILAKGVFEIKIDDGVALFGVNEFKIFQLWYNLIVFLVEASIAPMNLVVSSISTVDIIQLSFSINQRIESDILTEQHYNIIMNAKRDSNDFRMGIVKHLLSESDLQLELDFSDTQTTFSIDFPAKQG